MTGYVSSTFQYATSRKFRHDACQRARVNWPTGFQRGRSGGAMRRIPASVGVRFPFRTLQERHAQTTFSHDETPPRERGSTWSSDSSDDAKRPPQYWQRFPSRR